MAGQGLLLIIGLLLLPLMAAQDIAARLSDLNYVGTQMPKQAPFFFAHLDRSQYQRAVDDLSARLPSLSDAEFYAGLAHLVTLPGDAHTQLNLLTGPAFPLQFQWLDDGLYVAIAEYSLTDTLTTRVVAVNGLPIEDVASRLATVISHENDHWVHKRAEQYVRYPLVLEGLKIIPAGAVTADFTFRSLNGREFTRTVSTKNDGMTAAPDEGEGTIPAFRSSPSLFYWSTYTEASRLLYFKYNSCTNVLLNPFSTFAAGLLRTLDTMPVDTFVIDFRQNPGGNNKVIKPLLDGLQQRLPRLLLNPRFRVYVAFDKGSFSAAVDNSMTLKNPAMLPAGDWGNAIQTIGEAAGNSPSMYGNLVQFELPRSRLTDFYTSTAFPRPAWMPDGTEVLPDVPVPMRAADYFARFDPVMAEILARYTGTPRSVSADLVVVNGASFRPEQGIAAGSLATAFAAFPALTDEVRVAGQAARLVAASGSQVNFVVPESIEAGEVAISVRAGGKEVASGQAAITTSGAGIFVLQPSDPSEPGAIENQDSSVNSRSNPAAAGSIVQIFATGGGAAADAVQVLFNDFPSQVTYGGVVSPGLW